MPYDVHDTIAAIASAAGGGVRGVVRLSGPDAIDRLTECFQSSDRNLSLSDVKRPQRVAGCFRIDVGDKQPPALIPGDMLVWPSKRSYTRQPAAEFHTLGSPPLLAAVIEELQRHGVRQAAPGEFTLRAFLAGRIDLVQAEAVLGVIDACRQEELDAALDHLAGGLSRPLHRLREELLALLAELEAGLDFVEEDIEFISPHALAAKLAKTSAEAAAALEQLSQRDQRSEAPRVALVGKPNVGKSSLFNALTARFGRTADAAAIVSPTPGATRDYLTSRINLNGMACELIDAAGVDAAERDDLHREAQLAASRQRYEAELRIICIDATAADEQAIDHGGLLVLTKADLPGDAPAARTAGAIRCSSVTGEGLDELADRLRAALVNLDDESAACSATAAASARCLGALRQAAESLARAAVIASQGGGEELAAAEIRSALDGLGEMIGAVCADDVLDRIFSQFCIGK